MHFNRVRARVQEKHPGWSKQRLDKAVSEYRKFLALCKANPKQKVSAPPDVDEIWHTHILDTIEYAKDCMSYFGYFLHHDPCIGPADLESAKLTLQLYEIGFGETPPALWGAQMTCANPGGGCGSFPANHALA